jgi:hypothetical protein
MEEQAQAAGSAQTTADGGGGGGGVIAADEAGVGGEVSLIESERYDDVAAEGGGIGTRMRL